jgi:hypothetical protein
VAQRCGQLCSSLELDMNQIPLAMYPCAHGCVFTCTWLCIYMQMAIYPCALGHISTQSCIHVHVAIIQVHNMAMGYSTDFRSALWVTQHRILLFATGLGPSAEHVTNYGPHHRILLNTMGNCRILDHSAESLKIHFKVATAFTGIARQKNEHV